MDDMHWTVGYMISDAYYLLKTTGIIWGIRGIYVISLVAQFYSAFISGENE